MTFVVGEPPKRQRLAAALRQLRRDSGLTTTELARRIGVSQSQVSKFEHGQASPSAAHVHAWARETGADDTIRRGLLDQVEAAAVEVVEWRTAQRGLPTLQADIGELETSAARVATYSPALVPGLMQTPEYTRRVLEARGLADRRDAAAAIGARMQRQRVLYEPGRRLEFVVGEAALRRRFGPAPVIREQLDRVLAVAALESVRFGVLPLTVDLDVWMTHGFNLFDDRAGGDPAVVSVETLTVGLTVTQPDDVEEYRAAFARLLDAAAVGRDAEALVRAVQDDL